MLTFIFLVKDKDNTNNRECKRLSFTASASLCFAVCNFGVHCFVFVSFFRTYLAPPMVITACRCSIRTSSSLSPGDDLIA